jgi:uncharacterized protein GlcG (DUF336 family)
MASFIDEAAAKEAWLARQELPSWGPSPTALPAPASTEAVGGAWIASGRPTLTLEAADMMSTVALQEAAARGFAAVSVVVLDASGRPLVTKTMVACPTLAPELAVAKAKTCVGFHMSSRVFRDSYINGDGAGPKMPQALAMGMVGASTGQPVAPFPGGVLCRDAGNNVVGAIGVSGARSDEDEHCAILGAQAVGLVTEPARSALL